MSSGARAITGCILAGGRGERFAGEDKGLIELDGRPLFVHVIERFRPQVDELLISANRNHARYREHCPSVIADTIAGYAGPLAGIAAAMGNAHNPLLATAPCDCPFVPPVLVARLAQALAATGADIAVVRTSERLQPVFALIECALRDSLLAYLASGQRKIETWYDQHDTVAVDFDDDPDAFMNVNTATDLAAASAQLSQR